MMCHFFRKGTYLFLAIFFLSCFLSLFVCLFISRINVNTEEHREPMPSKVNVKTPFMDSGEDESDSRCTAVTVCSLES